MYIPYLEILCSIFFYSDNHLIYLKKKNKFILTLKDPYENALRLMCLLSVAQNGLSSTDYKSLVTQFRQVSNYF